MAIKDKGIIGGFSVLNLMTNGLLDSFGSYKIIFLMPLFLGILLLLLGRGSSLTGVWKFLPKKQESVKLLGQDTVKGDKD